MPARLFVAVGFLTATVFTGAPAFAAPQ